MAKPAVRRTGGGSGGDELVVDSGGKIKVISLSAGGSIVGSGGSRAAHIANPSMITVTAGSVLASKVNANFTALDTTVESMLTALRSIGVLATS